MLSRLTTKAIFFNWQTALLLCAFVVLRIFSFALAQHNILQALVVFLLVFTLGILFFKNPDWAWMVVLGEIFLGGSGHLFEFFGLSLRTLFVLTFLFLWTVFAWNDPEKRHQLQLPDKLFYGFPILWLFVAISAVIGILNGHGAVAVIQDSIPFAFFLILLPSFYLFKQEKIQHYFIRLVIVFLIGSALFSLFTFILFRTGLGELQDPFYKWFRDVIMGKITIVTDYYFRIVAPEHLLIPPIMLIVSSLLMRDEKHHHLWRLLFILGSIILALNFSRAYLLGFVIGLTVLLYKHKLRRWLKVSLWSVITLIIIFTGVNLISSLGKSLGWEIVGVRIGSLVAPHIETSAEIRMVLLEPIFQLITARPIIGNGLGASVTYIDPLTLTEISRRHFDWGYLELWAELGIIGAAWFMIVIGAVMVQLIKKIEILPDYHDLHVGLLGGLIAMLIINITTPALFHVLGVLYLIFVIGFITKPLDIFDTVVTTLYRIFNKLKNAV